MPTTLATHAVEKSTFAITAAFADDAGVPVVPNSGLTWSLYKKVGNPSVETVVNGRLNVAIASAATITIVLSGADLILVAGESRVRYLLIEGTFNSSLGSNLPLKEQVQFAIVNLIGT